MRSHWRCRRRVGRNGMGRMDVTVRGPCRDAIGLQGEIAGVGQTVNRTRGQEGLRSKPIQQIALGANARTNHYKMTHAERTQAIVEAMRTLKALGVPYNSDTARQYEAEREPNEFDAAWPLTETVGITDHLASGNREVVSYGKAAVIRLTADDEPRPPLSCALVKGRAYSLTPAQRDVVRKWYNMTPAPLVEVIDLAMFPGTKMIRQVVIRNEEHIDLGRRKHVLHKFTINEWGRFMHAAKERETEIQLEKELNALRGRVTELLKKAKDAGVEHRQTSNGMIAQRLHAEIIAKKLDDPQQIREELREICLSFNEHGLAKLVKEPKWWPDKQEKGPKVKSLDTLMNEYGMSGMK